MHLQHKALAALVGGAILIGLAPVFVRWIDVGYTAAAFWRVALALPLLLLLRPLLGAGATGARGGSAGSHRRWLWLAGVFFAGDLAIWHQSVRYTSVANATLLANLAPIFVTFAAWRLFGDRVDRRFLIGLLLALSGAGLLLADSLSIGLTTVVGDLCGILAALFYAGYQLGISRLRRHLGVGEVMWSTTLAAALVLLPVTLLLQEPLFPGSARGWLVLLGLALINQVAGQGLIAYGMAHLSAALSSVSLLVQPVAAALFAWALLAEPFGPQQALGGAIVLGGILLCRLASAKTVPAARAHSEPGAPP